VSILPRRPSLFFLALAGAAALLVITLVAAHPDRTAAGAVSFESGTLFNLTPHPAHATSLAFGPDDRLYVTTETSIRALTLTADGKHVTDGEMIDSGLDNVLGIAFDPTAPASPVTFYVSRQEPTAPDGYKGTISKYTAPDWNRMDVITGLPTSEPNLNHMTNGISFDSAGTLYIAQGSGSNSGIPVQGSDTYWHETPLSGAILVADIHAAGFDGAITYSPSGPPNSDSIDQTGGDVTVYAPGLRNPYDLVLHSNGHIYATDNGPMSGTTSLSCSVDGGSVDQSDELDLIEQGKYYGFPNRNRGRTDPRQCIYHGPLEGNGADFTAPIRILPAHCSCDGIAEYTSDAFGGVMQGDLIMAELNANAVGRIQLTPDGTGVASITSLSTSLHSPLDVTVGPTGIIYVGEYSGSDVVYLAPATGTPASPTDTATPGSPTDTATPGSPTATRTPTQTGPPTTTITPGPSPTPTATPTPRLVGDVNCDGVVDAIDAALVLQFSAGLILPLPCFGDADVNLDGNIDPIDATLILQYVAGLLPALPPP
jgi:glucose/arabinose dehydrogenase